MLVLSRKVSESILIGDDVVVTVISIQGNRVRLGVHAPMDTKVIRSELEFIVEASNDESTPQEDARV